MRRFRVSLYHGKNNSQLTENVITLKDSLWSAHSAVDKFVEKNFPQHRILSPLRYEHPQNGNKKWSVAIEGFGQRIWIEEIQ